MHEIINYWSFCPIINVTYVFINLLIPAYALGLHSHSHTLHSKQTPAPPKEEQQILNAHFSNWTRTVNQWRSTNGVARRHAVYEVKKCLWWSHELAKQTIFFSQIRKNQEKSKIFKLSRHLGYVANFYVSMLIRYSTKQVFPNTINNNCYYYSSPTFKVSLFFIVFIVLGDCGLGSYFQHSTDEFNELVYILLTRRVKWLNSTSVRFAYAKGK